MRFDIGMDKLAAVLRGGRSSRRARRSFCLGQELGRQRITLEALESRLLLTTAIVYKGSGVGAGTLPYALLHLTAGETVQLATDVIMPSTWKTVINTSFTLQGGGFNVSGATPSGIIISPISSGGGNLQLGGNDTLLNTHFVGIGVTLNGGTKETVQYCSFSNHTAAGNALNVEVVPAGMTLNLTGDTFKSNAGLSLQVFTVLPSILGSPKSMGKLNGVFNGLVFTGNTAAAVRVTAFGQVTLENSVFEGNKSSFPEDLVQITSPVSLPPIMPLTGGGGGAIKGGTLAITLEGLDFADNALAPHSTFISVGLASGSSLTLGGITLERNKNNTSEIAVYGLG